jgi:hypothetical protein
MWELPACECSSDGEQGAYTCAVASPRMISLFPPWRGEKTKVMHIPPATVLQRIESSC